MAINIKIDVLDTQGDNLIHVLAAKGDSHAPVLAQLLTLKTIPEGNSVFDLCQRNYTGENDCGTGCRAIVSSRAK